MASARLVGVLLLVAAMRAGAQEAPGMADGPLVQAAPIERRVPDVPKQEVQAEPLPPGPPYDPGMFQKNRFPSAQLAFLNQYAGAVSNEVWRDKQFQRVLKSTVPNVMFHYGRDKTAMAALDEVISGSATPVTVREGRYVTVAGQMGTYLAGRGFVWVDLQDGIVLEVFYFTPSNGEPTPTLTVFSKQVKEDSIEMTQLPPAFEEDLARWSAGNGVPLVTIRYFIGDANEKILLEHDEDYCAAEIGRPGDDCMQMMADAADKDMVAASYLEQVNYATNATARMIADPDQIAWIGVRDRTCGGVVDPLGCQIRMSRERVHVIERKPVWKPRL